MKSLIKNDYPLAPKLIEVLQKNLETKGVVDCLKLVIDKDQKLIRYLNPEFLSKKFNLEDYLTRSSIIQKCIDHKNIFSETTVNNLSRLLMDPN